jgi:hypothetical protein
MELSELETQLADKPEVLTVVKGLFERAGKFTPELEADVGKLSEYKSHSEAYVKLLAGTGAKDHEALLKDFGNLKTVNADLLNQKKTWAAGGKGTDSPEYRALEEKIAEGQRKIEEITTKMTDAEKSAETAKIEKRETDLKSSIVTAASKSKATEPEDIFILLKTKGLTGHNEDGTPFYRKLNDQGQAVSVTTAEEMVEAFAAKRKDLFAGSGVGGTGSDHRGKDHKVDGAPSPQEARRAFLDGRGKR